MNLLTDEPHHGWGFEPWAIHLLYQIRDPNKPGRLPDYAPYDFVIVMQGRNLIECMGRTTEGSLGHVVMQFKITEQGVEYLKKRVPEQNLSR